MRRAAWIFFASIFLPSLGLAWLAIHSVRDQQVVLEHQQAIICQNITDALAKNIQGQMDQVRDDFVKTTIQLLSEKPSPQILAQNFNRTLHEAWPSAEIGFAVNVDGEIYSPTPYDGPEARTFRDENDRFLSNRENVEVYSSNANLVTQNASLNQNAAAQFTLKLPEQAVANDVAEKAKQEQSPVPEAQSPQAVDALSAATKDDEKQGELKSASASRAAKTVATDSGGSNTSVPTGSMTSTAGPDAAAASVPATAELDESTSSAAKVAPALPVTAAPVAAPPVTTTTPPAASPEPLGGMAETSPTSASTAMNAPAPSSDAEAGLSPTTAVQSFAKIQRNVIPQQMLARDSASLSSTVPEESDFRRVIGAGTSGELARFLEDKMRLLVWLHPTADAPIVFGAQLDPDKLVAALKASLQIPELTPDSFSRSSDGEVCAAILDDTGHPVALSRPGFSADWKHPFVATEIGEVLPHWEAALYLVDPQQFSRAARTLQLTFGLIVLLLVAAIVSGGSLIAADVRRQVRLAQQKTDFVSNVSHELKTPLTSIRMFADLLAEKRVPDEERQATYLRIMAAEASRLTRLINNVLDFARLEKGAPHGEHADCDLVDAVRDVAETCGPHLEATGISFACEIEAETLPIRGDRDALAQIILNLISNAEKYGGNDILVRVRRQEISAGALGCVDVLDRGAGIPARQVKTIFEPFHRLDDSLSSGIPGSGLGLTLARRMARAHGGDVTYSARAGGGSCFTLAVPLAPAL
jgi:signal transduction histidine kinase